MVNYIFFNNTDVSFVEVGPKKKKLGGKSMFLTKFSSTICQRVIVRTNDQKVYLSENDGYSWTQLFKDTPIIRMLQNPHFEQRVGITMEDVTIDRSCLILFPLGILYHRRKVALHDNRQW
jgi:hypothetical protein